MDQLRDPKHENRMAIRPQPTVVETTDTTPAVADGLPDPERARGYSDDSVDQTF